MDPSISVQLHHGLPQIGGKTKPHELQKPKPMAFKSL